MKVTIIAAGSRADVQPYVALGKGLKEAEHTFRVLASRDFQSLITAHDLEFFDMDGSMEHGQQQTRRNSQPGFAGLGTNRPARGIIFRLGLLEERGVARDSVHDWLNL